MFDEIWDEQQSKIGMVYALCLGAVSYSAAAWPRQANPGSSPSEDWCPGRDLNPPRDCSRQILSLLRLPFRHPGTSSNGAGIIAALRPWSIIRDPISIVGDHGTFSCHRRDRTRNRRARMALVEPPLVLAVCPAISLSSERIFAFIFRLLPLLWLAQLRPFSFGSSGAKSG